MKKKDLKQKTKKELEEVVLENRQKLGYLKFESEAKKVKNIREIRGLRREIARAITYLKTK